MKAPVCHLIIKISIKKNVGDPPSYDYDIVGGTKIQKLSYSSEFSDMTSEGLGEMFEGDSADDGGPSRGSCVRRPGSEDPHRR